MESIESNDLGNDDDDDEYDYTGPAVPTIRVQGYTRWTAATLEQPETTAASSSFNRIGISEAPPPPKITISLSQEQITPKSTMPKPSGIPKRNVIRSPNVSTTAQPPPSPSSNTVDLYNEVFEDKPIGTVPPNQNTVPTVSERQTLLRKFSVPIIDDHNKPPSASTAVATTTTSAAAAVLGARLASHHAATVPASLASKAKFVASNANKYLEERYKCTMCCNPFSDPRVLDCLHTFCYVCLCNAETAASALQLTTATTTTTTAASAATVAVGRRASTRAASVTTPAAAAAVDVEAVVAADRHAVAGEGSSELDYSVSGTVKSSETAIFPKSYSITSSMGTTATEVRDRTAKTAVTPRHSISAAAGRKTDRKSSTKPGSSSGSRAYSESTPKQITCSLCGMITVVPVGGLNRLPCNYVIKRRVKDALLRLGRDLHTTVCCGLCFNDTLAIACCLICNLNLCTFCKEAHCRQRSTSLHDVRYLNDLRANYQQQEQEIANSGGARRLNNKPLKCPIHPTHDLKLFCVQCYQVACSNCTILLHRGHKCEPITKAAKVYVKMVRTALDRTRPLTDYASEAIAKLASHTKRINKRADTVQADVDRFLSEYLAALEVHQRTLHKQIGRAREAKMQTIREQQADMVRRCADARTAIQFTDDLLGEGSTDTEILAFVGVLLRRFEQCQRSRASLDPQLHDSLAFREEIRAPATQDQHNIPMYGIITTQTALPKLCTVAAEGLMQLRVHRKVEAVMTSRDVDDRQLCHGGLQVDVLVKYRDATGRAVPTTVSDRRDGTYVVAFVPDAAGAMVMSVQVQAKHVKGSPFGMCARTLRPHSGAFHCCAFCATRGSKTAVCACGSQMPGGYRGCGHGHEGHPGRRHWSCCASDVETSECSATNAFR